MSNNQIVDAHDAGYTRATVFYKDSEWLTLSGGDEPLFDYRVDAQTLPRGSVAIGYVAEQIGGVCTVPFCSDGQHDQLVALIEEIAIDLHLTITEALTVGSRAFVLLPVAVAA